VIGARDHFEPSVVCVVTGWHLLFCFAADEKRCCFANSVGSIV